MIESSSIGAAQDGNRFVVNYHRRPSEFPPIRLSCADRFQALLTARLRDLAISRSKQRMRKVVTQDDIDQCLGAVIADALRSFKTSMMMSHGPTDDGFTVSPSWRYRTAGASSRIRGRVTASGHGQRNSIAAHASSLDERRFQGRIAILVA